MYDIGVRSGLAVLLASATAQANPHLELGGFFGAEDFNNRNGLGDATPLDQRPQTSATLGARLTVWLVQGPTAELGFEPELAFMPAWTAYGFDGMRPSYFAPVLAYRGSLILRITRPRWFQPHILVGGGGESVVSHSPYLRDDTDPTLFYGVGATIPLGGGWLMRLDARQGWMRGNDNDQKASYEGTFGIGYRFGTPHPHHRHVEAPVVAAAIVPAAPPAEPVQPPPPPRDRDGDGIPDALDTCPTQPEDADHFEDADGCPDPDNDRDGIADAQDRCPNEPETFNGFEDEDGCPDVIPAPIAAAFAAASAVKFEAARARLTEAGKTSLGRAVAQLHSHPTMHVVVTGHPDGQSDKAIALAKKRAEVVRWYLVEQGIPADQLELAIGDVRRAPIELATAPPH